LDYIHRLPRLLDQLKIQQGVAPAKPYPNLMNTIPWGLLGGWVKDNPVDAASVVGSLALPSPVGDVLGVAGDAKNYIDNSTSLIRSANISE